MTAVTLPRVVHSEWTKLRTLRSTKITLAVAFALIVAFGLLAAELTVARWGQTTGRARSDFNPVMRSIGGLYLGQLAFMVLGVLFVTGEYSTGMVRATFAAVPKRLPVLWAKLGVYVVVTGVLATAAIVIAFTAGQAIFSTQHIQTSFSQPHVTRAVFGAAFYLTMVGALSLSVGALVRNTAAGISAMATVLFVLPPLFSLALPASWSDAVSPYLPSDAGGALFDLGGSNLLSPAGGAVLLIGYVVVATAAAAIMLKRRDA